MISIIISSHNQLYFDQLSKNIESSIGVPYELIQIWNPGTYSINEAYQKGLEQSQYDNLLYIHEDIEFLDQDWGIELLKFLKIENLGLVGLAGSNYYPIPPTDWFVSFKHSFINIMQSGENGPMIFKNLKEDYQQVLTLDGVFLFGKKSIFEEVGFDKSLKGFHAYDLSISLKVARKYQNFVSNKINIIHYSHGNPDLDWYNSTMYVRENMNWDFGHERDHLVENIAFRRFSKNTVKYWGKSYKSFKKIMEYYPRNYLPKYMDHLKLNWFLIKLLFKKQF